MFTGIVRERGRVAAVEGGDDARHLRIEAPGTSARLEVGDSVSIDGCCLTATAVADGTFSVTAVPGVAQPDDARTARSPATR